MHMHEEIKAPPFTQSAKGIKDGALTEYKTEPYIYGSEAKYILAKCNEHTWSNIL